MAELQKAAEIGHRLEEQLERTGDVSIAAGVGDVMSQIDAMVAGEVTSDGLELSCICRGCHGGLPFRSCEP